MSARTDFFRNVCVCEKHLFNLTELLSFLSFYRFSGGLYVQLTHKGRVTFQVTLKGVESFFPLTQRLTHSFIYRSIKVK